MNQHTDNFMEHVEMTRRMTFICLGVVLAIVLYRGIGGQNSISEGLRQARAFAVKETASLSQTMYRSGESLTHIRENITAMFRALSCIREELRAVSQPAEPASLRREVPRVSRH